jgi:hypothetical protein
LTLPLLKLTFHALFGLLANELDDQVLNACIALSACSRRPARGAPRSRRPGPAVTGEERLAPRPASGGLAFASRRRERDPVITARSARLAPRASPADSGHGPDFDS